VARAIAHHCGPLRFSIRTVNFVSRDTLRSPPVR
jgi:hypothetical protein